MRVLQINSVIDYGSTGRITRDLYDCLDKNGHDCVIAFGRGSATPGYKTIKIGSTLDQMYHGVYSRLSDRHGFASRHATKSFLREIDKYNPDIIQLHNLHGYYLNIEILFDYLASKDIPVVWLLHDQWAVSGHSAYFNFNLEDKATMLQTNRKELNNYPKTIGIGQSKRNFKDKKRLFTSINNMHIVTPSNWLSDFMRTTFLSIYPIETIHNGVDTNIFKVDKSNTEKLRWQWQAKNKVIILGVASVWDERKGLDDFIEISKRLPTDRYQIVLVGVDKKLHEQLSDNIIFIEKTNSVDELRDIYNVADMFVNPTYFDNFPTVNIEALACGTPVITYDTGGSPESVNELTGSVVPQGDKSKLVLEIEKWGEKTDSIILNCRNNVLHNFSKDIIFQKYITLFNDMLKVNCNEIG